MSRQSVRGVPAPYDKSSAGLYDIENLRRNSKQANGVQPSAEGRCTGSRVMRIDVCRSCWGVRLVAVAPTGTSKSTDRSRAEISASPWPCSAGPRPTSTTAPP